MKKVIINKTDLQITPICLGAASFGGRISEQLSFDILDRFADFGGNFIDTAAVYGQKESVSMSELTIGKWLKTRNAKNTMIVATKGAHYPIHPKPDRSISRVNKRDVETDIHNSMKALGLDVLDFYWLHRDNPAIPIEEILNFMEDFKKEGLIRFYGASNYSLSRLEEAKKYSEKTGITGFSAVSNEWSPARKNPEHIKIGDPTLVRFSDSDLVSFKETGMSFIPYSSTAGGYFEKRAKNLLPPEKEQLYNNKHNDELYRKLADKAKETGKTIQAELFGHIISEYDVQIIPITAVSNLEQLNAVGEFLDE